MILSDNWLEESELHRTRYLWDKMKHEMTHSNEDNVFTINEKRRIALYMVELELKYIKEQTRCV